jgi:predicted RecA/RadA family phage recombinase
VATFVQEGKSIDYTPGSAVASGDVIVQGGLVGIAVVPIAANDLGALTVEGVFNFTKNSGETWAVGDAIYWDESEEEATLTSSGNVYLGLCVLASASALTTGNVKLQGPGAPDLSGSGY